ncbi:MAG: cytochrome P450 [Acidimicrobiales bacterium]
MSTPVAELTLPTYEPIARRNRGMTRDEIEDYRQQHWMVQVPFGYQLLDHDDCIAVLKDKRWHQAIRLVTAMSGITDEEYLARRQRTSILSAEGDEHQRLRRLVSGAFTPRSADRLRPFMREVINDLLDRVTPSGRCELVNDVCDPYPIPIVCELLGAPKEDWELFSRWATDIFKSFDADVAEHTKTIMAASDAMDAYVADLIAARRDDPREDLLSDLIAAEEEGDRLSTEELVMLAEAVLLAGTDTTRNQLACALAVFAEHPDQWAMLAEHPELAPRAAEESLRYLGAVRGTGRFASEDIEYRDILFPQGTLVFPNFVAANNDPSRFDTPGEFDITAQRESTHLTLGFGLHYCLGANLARAELQEALVIMSQRMPNLRLDGEPVYKPAGVGIWGPASLPLAFDPT